MDLKKMMDFRNSHNPFCQRLGIRVEELRPGYARAVKTVTEEDTNPVGVPHGGLYFTLADTACGFAMATHGHVAVTIDASYHFMRSAKVCDCLTAEAHEIKSGKTICVYDTRISDQNATLLGTGTFTFFQMEQELEQ